MPDDGRGVGASLLRKEDARHLHGRGEFVSDIKLPGTMEVAFVRSPHAHARIRSISVPPEARGRVFTAADLPRISVRTLIPLMQHLSASLSLLDEKVIRDDPPTAPRSRCVSTPANVGKSIRPSDGRHSAPLAESVDRDANPDCSNDRRADAANASDPRHARKGTGSC